MPVLRLDVDDLRGEVRQQGGVLMDLLVTIGIVLFVLWMLGSSSAKGNDIDRTVPEPPDDWEG